MRVPFFDYPRLFTDDKELILQTLEEVGARGGFIMQKDLSDFEYVLADYIGCAHAMGVGNATDALEFGWMSLGLRPGDEVIISSHTMLATASAIKTAGGTPVPVEIGPDNLIDPDAVEDAITPRTVGLMPTQLNGRTCNMDRLMSIKEKHGLFMVEDSAQALGSKFKGRSAGTFGEAGAISFFPAKVLGCLGDGGAFITNNASIADRAWQLHDHGRDRDGEIRSWGRNSRLDNLQAALLHKKLATYEDVISRRRTVAAIYQERLQGLEQLGLPPGPSSSEDHFDVYQNYEFVADRRDQLRDYLAQYEIGTLIQWGGKGVHQWERLGFTCRLPRTEAFFESCLMIPMNCFLSDDQVHYVCDKIIAFYNA